MRRDEVLAALSSDAPRHRADIADELGISADHVSVELNNAQKINLCKRTPDGWLRVGYLPGSAFAPDKAAVPTTPKPAVSPAKPSAPLSNVTLRPPAVGADAAARSACASSQRSRRLRARDCRPHGSSRPNRCGHQDDSDDPRALQGRRGRMKASAIKLKRQPAPPAAPVIAQATCASLDEIDARWPAAGGRESQSWRNGA